LRRILVGGIGSLVYQVEAPGDVFGHTSLAKQVNHA
jgi:hypothetical protein